MATRNSRDVTLTLAIESLGEDNVDRLKQSVLQLAKEGGSAAPEFQRLADEIDRIGAQGQALKTFQDLAQQTQDLRTKQADAATSAEKLAADLIGLREAAAQAAAKQSEAATQVAQAKANYDAATLALRQNRSGYDENGVAIDNYKAKVSGLLVAQSEARAELDKQKAALNAAAGEVRDTEKALTSAEKAYQRTAAGADRLGQSLKEQEAVLREAAQAAEKLGVATDDIAASEAQLLQSLNAAGRAAQERTNSIREMIEADRLLAIEERAMADLLERGRVALLAEEAAQRDAANAVKAYAAAKEQAVADAAAWQQEADAIVSAAEASRRAEEQTRRLVEERRALEAQKLRDQLTEEAAATEELTARMRVWAQAFADIDRKAEEAAAAAKKVDDAFKTIDVRQPQQLTDEIQRIRAALETVANSGTLTGQQLKVAFASGEAQIRELERQLRELNGTLTLTDKAAGLLKNSMGQIAAGNLVADAIASLVERVKEMGREFINVITSTERLRRALDAIYKDSGLAARQFQVLQSVAQEAGVSVNQLQQSFVRFSASAQSAGVNVQVANDLFRNLTLAGASLGLTSDNVAGALDALGQIASKGVVSLEELRQQLGDRLPGAMGLTAKGLGITEAQLIKLVEAGNLTADQFFPAFSKALVTMQGDTNTLSGAWARFTNLLTSAAQSAGDSGWLVLLSGGLRVLGTVLGTIVLTLQSFSEGLFVAGRAALAFYETLRGNGAQAWEFFNEELRKSNERLVQQTTNLYNFATGTNTAAAGVNTASVALSNNTSVVLANAAAQERAAGATTGLGNAYIQALVKMAEVSAAVEAAIAASEKLAKAKDLEGKAVVEAAKVSGDAEKQAVAAAQAAEANVLAVQKVVAARQAEVDNTNKAIAVIQAEGVARGGITSAMKQQLDTLENKRKKQEADLEASKQEVANLQALVVATRTVTEAQKDNSAAVDGYRVKQEALNAAAASLRETLAAQESALDVLKAALDRGNISQATYNERVKEAQATRETMIRVTQEAAEAERLYKDATVDAAANIERRAAAESAALQISQAQISVSQAKYERMAAEAKASGNLALAAYAEAQARREHIKVMELEIKIQQLQIAAKEQSLKLQIAEISGTDDASRAKKAQLELELELLKVQQEAIKAKQENIKQAKAEADAIARGNGVRGTAITTTQSVTSATNAHTEALEKLNMRYKLSADYSEAQIAILEKEAAAAERAAEAYRKKWNIDKEGFTLDANGNRMQQNTPYERYVYDTAKAQGLSDKQALALTDQFWRNGGPSGTSNAAGGASEDWFTIVNKAISEAVLQAARDAVDKPTTDATATGTTTTTKKTASPTTGSGVVTGDGTKTVSIVINGNNIANIGVNTSADANNLVSALRALETQANSAS